SGGHTSPVVVTRSRDRRFRAGRIEKSGDDRISFVYVLKTMKSTACIGGIWITLLLACHSGASYGPGTPCPCRAPLVCAQGRCEIPDGSPGDGDAASEPPPPGMCSATAVAAACPEPPGHPGCERIFCGGRLWRNQTGVDGLITYRIDDPAGQF